MELVDFLRAQLDEDDAVARSASGSTVVGEPGNWKPAPGGDEWEVSRDDGYADELLVALRPGLSRPPEVLGGYWGVVVGYRWESEEPDTKAPLSEFRHAARHDPARVLREIDAKRQNLAELEAAELAMDQASRDQDTARYNEVRAEWVVLRRVVRRDAAVYADRPGYRGEWRP